MRTKWHTWNKWNRRTKRQIVDPNIYAARTLYMAQLRDDFYTFHDNVVQCLPLDQRGKFFDMLMFLFNQVDRLIWLSERELMQDLEEELKARK